MSEWQEDNFLEKLTHGSSQAEGRACPHIEEFCAATTSGTASPPSVEFLDHLDRCPICSDLHNRLALFDRANGQEMNTASPEVEQRLDSWLKGFLAAQTLTPQVPEVATAAKVIALPPAQKASPFWRVQWALAAAAIILITAGVMYIRRPVSAPTPAPVVAHTTPEQQPLAPSDSRSLQQPGAADSPTSKNITQKPPQMRQSPAVASRTPKTPHTASPQPRLPAEQAPQVVAQTTPSAEGAPNQNEKGNPTSSPTLPTARVVLSPKMQASPQGMNSSTQPVGTMGRARSNARKRVQLPSGTRIWLNLDSVTPESGGSFQFRATLLLPITISGATLLEKGTQVNGSGQTNKKQTVIQITKIVSRGKLFILNSASTGILRAPGSGNALSFEDGKVFEVWLDSVSTFEAAEEPGGNPRR